MKARYNSSVKTPAGWRGVEIVATVEKISDKRVKVLAVELIDGETPNRNQSRTAQNVNNLTAFILHKQKKAR